jgi:hypothetical protein
MCRLDHRFLWTLFSSCRWYGTGRLEFWVIITRYEAWYEYCTTSAVPYFEDALVAYARLTPASDTRDVFNLSRRAVGVFVVGELTVEPALRSFDVSRTGITPLLRIRLSSSPRCAIGPTGFVFHSWLGIISSKKDEGTVLSQSRCILQNLKRFLSYYFS